jgi:hypothetical protein
MRLRGGACTRSEALVRAVLAALLAVAALAASSLVALAADPSASPGSGGDVRTNPTAPGLVGDPFFAIAGVVVVGLLAVALTLVAVRLADGRHHDRA